MTNPQRCGADLTRCQPQELAADHPALAAQHRILEAVVGRRSAAGVYVDSPVPLRTYLHDLTALAHHMVRSRDNAALRERLPVDLQHCLAGRVTLKSGEPTSLPWIFHIGTKAPMMAAAACLAVPIVMSATATQAGDRLRWLVASPRRQALSLSARTTGWAREVSDELFSAHLSCLRPFLSPIEQLRYRCTSVRPGRPRPGTAGSRGVPALLWPRWALTASPNIMPLERVQAALSVAVLVVGSHLPVPAACAALGSIIDQFAVSRVLRSLHGQSNWSDTATMLTGLADQLAASPGPIDYGRRRELPINALLTARDWRNVVKVLAVNAEQDPKAHLYRYWLYQRLTGSPPRHGTGVDLDRRTSAELDELPRSLTPPMVDALNDVGRRFLDRYGLAHEPLSWQPTDIAPGSGSIDAEYC